MTIPTLIPELRRIDMTKPVLDYLFERQRKKYTRLEAYMDLVRSAVKGGTYTDENGRVCDLRPGEILVSVESLVSRWGWSRRSVYYFFDKLKSLGQVVSAQKIFSIPVDMVALKFGWSFSQNDDHEALNLAHAEVEKYGIAQRRNVSRTVADLMLPMCQKLFNDLYSPMVEAAILRSYCVDCKGDQRLFESKISKLISDEKSPLARWFQAFKSDSKAVAYYLASSLGFGANQPSDSEPTSTSKCDEHARPDSSFPLEVSPPRCATPELARPPG
ncbi:MAG: hypothetical protein LIP09_09640 [Bacteroidales bacterium]|nr:hypothetical protein [Bacteroidales bacterium]